FFRKMVRFVANPGTDWTELNSRQPDARELELEKSELKAMIERKRRNDFVRKREFDMLRKVRREGLSPEQLAALGSSSRLDDSDLRLSGVDSSSARTDVVKAKIDAIEQQMVGEAGSAPAAAPGAAAPAAPAARRPVYFNPPTPGPTPASSAAHTPGAAPDIDLGAELVDDGEPLPPLPALPADEPELPPGPPPRAAPAPVQMASGLPPLAPMSVSTALDAIDFNNPLAVEVSEVLHDPDLDEAVIAFANTDFTTCEQSLRRLTAAGGTRHQHAETWLVLFDLYRATGQQAAFESLAVEYAHLFGWSAPQWVSLPRLVAEAVAAEAPAPVKGPSTVGWVAPADLGAEAVARLRAQTLQMPLPWVFDWGPLRRIETDAALQLSTLFRLWAGQALEMRWLSGEQLFTVLQDAAPTGVRDADPAFWMTRLDALRLVNRPDQFDESAIDYCVTYEVSPPSWEPTRCTVRVSGSTLSTQHPHQSVLTEVNTGFVESSLLDDGSGGNAQVAAVELSGQLAGDISETLLALTEGMGNAATVSVSCTRLIRVDFIAAGDLLNWVLARQGENRAVHFIDAHRLVALFFGAMGINEHARVQVRKD
ncbi:MAG: hypothetical protein IT501_04020, partial [Rubrivivax sp.]|nr:hypothetical protein [Rubrivivax sp.]